METTLFFDEILKLMPIPTNSISKDSDDKPVVTKILNITETKAINDNVISIWTPEYALSEIRRLKLYVSSIPKDNQGIIIEDITNELFHAYYQTRRIMKAIGHEGEYLRALMNAYYEAVTGIIISSVRDLHLKYSSAFIESWSNRTDYFPFKDLMQERKEYIPKVNKDIKRYNKIPYEIKIQKKNVLPTPKGRNVKSFRDLIQYKDPERLLKRLHELIDENKGKDVGVVLLKCLKEKYIMRIPTEEEFKSEFKLCGQWRSITTYTDEKKETARIGAENIVLFP